MKITSKNNSLKELKFIEMLKELLRKYDLPIFTREIIFEEGVIPRSHPILTLNTRVEEYCSLLKIFIHEQFHWFAQQHSQYNSCITYLKTRYKDDGEHNRSGKFSDSYWQHIIVCFNTRNYLMGVLSQEDIDWVYQQWQAYPTLEKLVVKENKTIKEDLEKFNMVYKK